MLVSVCLSVSLSACLPACLPACPPARLSARLHVRLVVCLPVCLSVCLTDSVSVSAGDAAVTAVAVAWLKYLPCNPLVVTGSTKPERIAQARPPKLTVAFSQSSRVLMTYRVAGAGGRRPLGASDPHAVVCDPAGVEGSGRSLRLVK